MSSVKGAAKGELSSADRTQKDWPSCRLQLLLLYLYYYYHYINLVVFISVVMCP